jgi:hypothetical protein
MPLFFDLGKLEAQAAKDPNKFMALLEYHHTKKPATNFSSKYKPSIVSLHGYSYLLNPTELFKDTSTDVLFKLQYVKLASYRDYLMYTRWGSNTLQTSYFPDLRHDVIRSNPLLKITPTEIHFKYE